ncbi:hypothetical protein C8F04DRAFT_1193555 [Mycena alexandri]|uniref:Uncharacterized protein n=1 Tax=Mycena alexandri TaxID=1745969 RepID=A0AAD6WW28_9AGAR|nr:hypothetical protein C8F04DRAFT_1193555 [Mycena alexandri]
MAEQFVVLCGYEGDEDVPSREARNGYPPRLRDYARRGAWIFLGAGRPVLFYGVGTRTKERQIREILDHGHLLHRFGNNLLRYDHTLGSRAYRIPTCTSEERIFDNSLPVSPVAVDPMQNSPTTLQGANAK